MKIGISGIFLKYPTSGLGQLLIHMLKTLEEVDHKNEYIVLGAKSTPWLTIAGTSFSTHTAPVPGLVAHKENFEQIVWEQITGPHTARKLGIDLFHIPYYAPPFVSRSPTIITIADVIMLRSPLYRDSIPARRRFYLDMIARAASRAAMIITLSNHAKQDIVETLKLPPDLIRVVYPAVGENLVPIIDQEVLAKVRARYHLSDLYILYLGGLDQRKNVLQVVRAFADLCQQSCDPHLQLFIVGDPDKQSGPLYPDPRTIASKSGIADRVVYGFVREEDKAAIYSGASLFLFPSLYEGFGLPPLEAMSCGTPVICSNCTSLPEVVGDAAISLDPYDTIAWTQAMKSILDDSSLHADLRARGIRQAAQFTWHKTAVETIAVYEEAVARSRR